MKLNVKDLLERGYNKFCRKEFIEDDPVSIPHRFVDQEDIEISGFFSASIAWGKRKTILRNAEKLMVLMDNQPHKFLISLTEKQLEAFEDFVHRTFNGADCQFFISSLSYLYKEYGGLGNLFQNAFDKYGNIKDAIIEVRSKFFELPHLKRTEKHFANPFIGASAKRLNMFLRWMVRDDREGVDFGLWKRIPPAALMIPLDVHSGRIAREIGLLNRNSDDWKAVEELTCRLREFDPDDPVRYDYALFGLGVVTNK